VKTWAAPRTPPPLPEAPPRFLQGIRPGAICVKLFTAVIYELCLSIWHYQAFQLTMMFVDKARRVAYLKGAKFLISSSRSRKNNTRLEKLARGKLSSFLGKFANYDYKMLYNIGPCSRCYTTFYGRNLRIFIIG
jgi:hypothetical protein